MGDKNEHNVTAGQLIEVTQVRREAGKMASAVSQQDDGIKLVAHGTDSLADEIIRVARASDVPVIENFNLCRQLENLPVGEYIPEKVFFAMTQLLEYIYALDDHTIDPPD